MLLQLSLLLSLFLLVLVLTSTSHAFVLPDGAVTMTGGHLSTATRTSTIVVLNMNKNNKSSRANKQKPNRAKPKGFAGALRTLQLASFSYSGTVRPGKQSPQKIVLEDIPKPDYSQDGMVCAYHYIYVSTYIHNTHMFTRYY